MALTFPANPTVGQTYVANDYTYAWDGVKWSSVKREVTNVFDTVNHMISSTTLSIGDWCKVINPLSDYVIQATAADVALGNGLHAREITQATAAPVVQPRQLGDGIETSFSHPAGTSEPSSSFFVMVDGLYKAPDVDYISSLDSITFTQAPANGATIDITYFKPVTVDLVPGADVSKGKVSIDGGPFRSLEDRFAEVVNVKDFGAVGDGVTDDTAAIQAAVDSMESFDTLFIPKGVFLVSHILLDDKRDIRVDGSGALAGLASDGGYVLELKNCTGVTATGSITISANINYTGGIKVWGEVGRTTSLMSLSFNVTNAKTAWFFGDISNPDGLCSEIVVYNGYTYNTPKVVEVYGTQAVIEFNGYQMISNGVGDFASEFHIIGTVVGGLLHVNGGETQIPAVTNGYAFNSQAINSPEFDNTYGSIFLNGCALESASLWFIATSPIGFTAKDASGAFHMDNVTGFHSFTGQSIQTAPEFTGKIVVDKTCYFHSSVPRTQPTVSCLGGADVYLDEGISQEGDFREGINGISGGIAHFPTQKILEARGLNGQIVNAGASETLIFPGVDSVKFSRHFANYNASTGVFTVPLGGLKDVRSVHQIYRANGGVDTVEVYGLTDNALIKGGANGGDQFTQFVTEYGDLSEGQTIQCRYVNIGGDSITFGSDDLSYFSLYARN